MSDLSATFLGDLSVYHIRPIFVPQTRYCTHLFLPGYPICPLFVPQRIVQTVSSTYPVPPLHVPRSSRSCIQVNLFMYPKDPGKQRILGVSGSLKESINIVVFRNTNKHCPLCMILYGNGRLSATKTGFKKSYNCDQNQISFEKSGFL